jgi:predicted Fe-Mo cluster-binding NifX family protein
MVNCNYLILISIKNTIMGKYLVASSGDTLDSKVSGRFGHSGYFLIIDPLTMEYEAFPGVSNFEDHTIRKFADTDIKRIIVGNIGPAMYNEVTARGCKVYMCRNMPVPEAIKRVKNGDIPVLKEPTLKDSIHSARKTGYNYSGWGKGSIRGRGTGSGSKISRGMGTSRDIGKGQGRGKVR